MKALTQWIFALLCAFPVAALIKEDARMMAYVGNWQTCPSDAQLEQYTHIAIGFAVTYTFALPKNQCSETCVIEWPLICENQAAPTLVSEWKARGIKVLLSFGGAGMGGSWEGDANDCWKYCFGREDYVIDRLVELVNTMNLDGIDLDYEYFLEDNLERGFTQGAEAINFLETVTVGLRQRMPDKIVTHAPMDAEVVAGTEYFEMLKRISYTLDFIMPQYYNGITRPNLDGFSTRGEGEMAPVDHYNGLLEVFDNDPTRIVFGFCINDCGGTNSNADALQAANVIIELQSQYPCHGGAFFWVNLDDTNGEWSRQVNQAQSLNRGCTISAGVGPTPPPVAFPVSVPVTIPVPSFPIPVSPVSLPLTPIATPTNSVPSFPSPVSPVSLPLTPTATPTNSIPPAVSLPSENLPTFPETSPSPQPTGPTTPSTSSPFSMISTGTRPVGNNPNEPNFFDPNNSRSSAFASSQAPFFVLFVAMPTWALVIF